MVDLFNIDAKSSFWGVAGVGSFVDGAAAVFGADTHLTQATRTQTRTGHRHPVMVCT
jgi:hypothetical protein